MLNNDAVTLEEITDIWIDIAGDLKTPVDRKMFGRLNIALDDYIEEKESMSDEDDDEDDEDMQGLNITSHYIYPFVAFLPTLSFSSTSLLSYYAPNSYPPLSFLPTLGIDIYDPSLDPRTFFDEESLVEITNFFTAHADDGGSLTTGKLSYSAFLHWDDILAMKEEELLTDDDLADAWEEAADGGLSINYDRFLRLNVRLDLLMDDNFDDEEGDEDDDDEFSEDAESFYRSEFVKMTGNAASTMTQATLLEWKEVKDLIEDGVVTKKQITKMFESIPKAKDGSTKASEGISQDAFVEFNGMLDELLERLAGK